jgi:hypothetical protein
MEWYWAINGMAPFYWDGPGRLYPRYRAIASFRLTRFRIPPSLAKGLITSIKQAVHRLRSLHLFLLLGKTMYYWAYV